MPARTDPADRELVIRRMLPAPPERVWEVWTVPGHIAQWWGPRGFTAFSCEMDPRPGGRWRVGMRSPDGDTLWTRGEFHEVVRPTRLVMSFAWEASPAVSALGGPTLVIISFTARGDQTEVVIRQHAFDTVEARDRHGTGWSECLDRFAEYIQQPTEPVEV